MAWTLVIYATALVALATTAGVLVLRHRRALAAVEVPPLRLTLSNADRVVLAHWLSSVDWQGTPEHLEARSDVYNRLRLREIQPHHDTNGALLGMHLPIPAQDAPPLRADIHTLRKHDLKEKQNQDNWLNTTFEVLIPRASVCEILTVLPTHKVPANLGIAFVSLLKTLRSALEAKQS